MNADEREFPDSVTERVLGAGFLAKVYERALLRELEPSGLRAGAQASYTVTYKGHRVGEYSADIPVEDVPPIELKCVERLGNEHTAQCFNCLRASGLSVCLFVRFQSYSEFPSRL